MSSGGRVVVRSDDKQQTCMDTRSCCSCSAELPFTAEHFPRDHRKPAGLAYRCRECARSASRAWKVSGKGKAAARKWYYSELGQAYREVANKRRCERAAAKRAAGVSNV
jgi:hypothetical protein